MTLNKPMLWALGLALLLHNCHSLLTTGERKLSYKEVPSHESDEETINSNSRESTTVSDKVNGRYEPNWASLDTRPLPTWYDNSKFGIFIHWGVFSVPGFGGEWFWYNWKGGNKACVDFMEKNYPPNFTYQDFGREFRAEFFDPIRWASVFNQAGAKYVVLTSKHHEGYSLWPSKYSFGWNARDVGPGRDLVGELAEAIREKTDIRFGLYHSLFEWFNPVWLADRENNFTTDDYVRFKAMPELYELVEKYKPEVVWSDGINIASDTYWQATKFIAWLYNDSPVNATVVTNDRWGPKILCKHGDFLTCKDNYNPGVLQKHKWENCMSIDTRSWGYRRNSQIEEYHTSESLIHALVTTVSCGGNLLLNIGPTKEGTIDPAQEERLLDIGKWLKTNGDAIYESKPWKFQNDTLNPTVWYTSNESRQQVYAIALKFPGRKISLASVDAKAVRNVTILGCNDNLVWTPNPSGGTIVNLPRPERIATNWAWTLVFHMKV